MHALQRTFAVAVLAASLAGCGGSKAPGASPPPSLDPSSPTLVAKDVAFDTDELRVPANRPFTLVFENLDGFSHNVAIDTTRTLQPDIFDGEIFSGPATRWYPVPALAPGRYTFFCSLHSGMTGRLVAS